MAVSLVCVLFTEHVQTQAIIINLKNISYYKKHVEEVYPFS